MVAISDLVSNIYLTDQLELLTVIRNSQHQADYTEAAQTQLQISSLIANAKYAKSVGLENAHA
jgi:hypothetical protein